MGDRKTFTHIWTVAYLTEEVCHPWLLSYWLYDLGNKKMPLCIMGINATLTNGLPSSFIERCKDTNIFATCKTFRHFFSRKIEKTRFRDEKCPSDTHFRCLKGCERLSVIGFYSLKGCKRC